jgi:PAS domain S-box-containing protein
MEQAEQTGCAEDKRWHLRQDGSLFWANGMVMPVKNDNGSLRGFAKVMRDDTAHKLLEERLRESEEFNRSILASSVDCIKVLDLDGKLLSMNSPGLCIMEIDDFGDFYGRQWTDFWTGDVHEQAVEAVDAARRGRIGRFQGFAETAKGNRKYWDVIVSPMLDQNGKPKQILSVSRDISEQKRNEEMLAQSKRRVENILESITDCFFTLDTNRRFTYVNSQTENYFGIPKEQMLGRAFTEVLPKIKGHEIDRRHEEALIRRTPVHFEALSPLTGKWVELHLFPTDEGLAVYFRDVTDRKQAEENLKYQKTLLEALTESVLDGILIVSPDGKLLHFNQHFMNIWNFPPEVLESKSDEMALKWAANQTADPQQFLARVGAVYGHPDDKVREELLMKDGRVFERFGSPIHDDNGNRLGWVWTFRDITSRKRIEKNLAFLAEVSEELPLLANSWEIKQTIAGKIGKYLGVSHCIFAEVDTVANTAFVNHGWRKSDEEADLVGNYKLSEFVTDEFRQTLISRRPVVVNDVASDSRTAEHAANFELLKISSFIITPFVSGSDLKFVLGIYRHESYEWQTDEIELLGELMTRVWTRIERARAEEELRESEKRYRTLFDSMDEGFCSIEVIFDASGEKAIDYRFLEINPAFEKLTGISQEDALHGKTIRQIIPNLEEKWFEIYGRVALTGEPVRFVEGSEAMGLWFDIYAFRIGVPENSRVALLFNNITERKRAELEREQILRQLETERARLNYLFEKAPAFVATLRGENHVFDLTNPAYLQLIGHRNMTGKPVREALPEIEGQGFFELLDNVYQTGEPFIGKEMPVEIQREPDGELEKRFVDFVFQPIFETDKLVSGIFVHGVDITEQVESRRQAESANRLKDEFLATLSHELRTPLNAILGWSQILQNRNLGENDTQKALTTIERNARSQSQLIDDVLDVSRIVTGKLRLNVRAVDLPGVITAAVDAARPGAEAKNIRLQTLLDPDAGPISGDPDRLQQVVWNLLSNAMKFTPKNGRVQVRLERVNSHVEIVVSDTGKGIEPEFLPYVFDRFRQSDGSMTRRHGGLGLGLAIVRQLVELHGGTVSVSSAGEGSGATFTVSLPILPMRQESVSETPRVHPTAESGASLDCPPELSGLRVLLVDDEADSRDLLNLILYSCGADVVLATSAIEALETIRNEKFDVIISDIGMPDEDGFSLIKKIRELSNEEGGDVPAIALTAYARAEDRVKALRSGFQMHVAKPVEPAELVAIVANLAGRMRNLYRNETE